MNNNPFPLIFVDYWTCAEQGTHQRYALSEEDDACAFCSEP